MKCPICENTSHKQLLSLNCGNFYNSTLYNPVIIVSCLSCGHIYNLLTKHDEKGLINYYENEYSINNLSSPNKQGDIPGSSNTNSLGRYFKLFDFIKSYIGFESNILDIGCATGGFLKFLRGECYKNLYGVEPTSHYVDEAKKNKELIIKKGFAEKVPFGDEKFDFILSDQVIEHLSNPSKLFIEANRLLKQNGYLCIGAPNALLYEDNYFFDFYWFIMREHIQHFDIDHLSALAKRHGFSLVDHRESLTPMLSDKVMLPNMYILFYKNDCPQTRLIGDKPLVPVIEKYINTCNKNLKIKYNKMKSLLELDKPLYVWGMSREFLYLYENTALKDLNIIGFLDDTKFKQDHMTINGRKIESSLILKDSHIDVLITATAHIDILSNKLKEMNYKGNIITI